MIMLGLLALAAPAQPAPRPAESTVVRYEDFGAVGDGVADDYPALAKAHEFANEKNHPVIARDGATYRIGKTPRAIAIETNADFGKAKFIIDDAALDDAPHDVFEIRSRLKSFSLTHVKTLRRQQTKIDVSLPASCVIIAMNKNVSQYIRRGNNANDGSPQTDVLLVHADGRISPTTPVIWNFDQITSVKAYPMDQGTLTIKGGHFTTIANRTKSDHGYFGRGIGISRSNVVVDGIEHHITGEGEHGAPYGGFISVSNCANVLIRNSVFTGHKTYRSVTRTSHLTPKGTYDLRFDRAIHVTLFRCRQSNDILDTSRWGIMGSNFCKNLTYDQCQLSRFDAHQGVTHATIRNSVIGHAGLQLTGFGTFVAENTTVKSHNFIDLRPDYGSTWTGEWIIRNCRFEPQGKLSSPPCLFNGSNDGQHDFGYECQMPWRIRIEGLHVVDGEADAKSAGPYVFDQFNSRWSAATAQPFPYRVTKELHLKNITTSSGKPMRLSNNPAMFHEVKAQGL